MKSLIVAAFLMAVPSAGFAAVDAQSVDMVPSYYISPCGSSWSFNSPGNGGAFGYLCNSPGQAMSVPDANALQSVLTQMDQRIQTLEQKVHQLEAQVRNQNN